MLPPQPVPAGPVATPAPATPGPQLAAAVPPPPPGAGVAPAPIPAPMATPGPAPAPMPAPTPTPAPVSPSIPTGIPQAPVKPPVPPSPLPPIQRTMPPQQGITAENAVNPFERVAAMIADKAQEMAQNLSDNLSEQPANSHELSPDEIKSMWYYSPNGQTPTQADATFWQVHDQVLAQTGDPNQAETQAMKASYPYRPILAQVGSANAEKQVQVAEYLRKSIDGDQAPDSAQVAQDAAYHSTQIRNANGSV